MKRKKIPGLIDIIVVDDPLQIRAIAEDPGVDRLFRRRPLLNGVILGRRLGVLSYQGKRFPHQQPCGDSARAAGQDALWKLYNDKAPEMAEGPEVLDDLARWIKGQGPDIGPGILVQQVVGSFFNANYKATPESWAAAVTISKASGSGNIPRLLWWYLSGRIGRAKKLLGSVANNDLFCIHGTTVAVHNIVAGVVKMKGYYADEERRRSLTPEKAAGLCLSPPPVVYRQAKSAGEAAGCPFSKYSMFLLQLGKAYSRREANDLVFMTGSWSRCPAGRWVPAMLAGVWKRACATC